MGFSSNIETAVDIPSIKAPDFSRNTSTAQDLVGLLSFGAGLMAQNKARTKETARQATVLEGQKIISDLTSLAGQMTSVQLNARANKMIRGIKGGLGVQSQIGSMVASHLGHDSMLQSTLSAVEKRENNLEQEYNKTKELGIVALEQLQTGRTFSELNNKEREEVVELSHKMQLDAETTQGKIKKSKKDIEAGNLAAFGDLLQGHKENATNINGIMLPMMQRELRNISAKDGFKEGDMVNAVQQMKASYTSTFTALKNQLLNDSNGSKKLGLSIADQKRIEPMIKSQMDWYDNTIKFVDEMTTEEFQRFGEASKVMQDRVGFNLINASPQLEAIKQWMTPKAFGDSFMKLMVTNPDISKNLQVLQRDAFNGISNDKDSQFNLGLSIVAGIGKGVKLEGFDESLKAQASSIYWETTKNFINTKGVVADASPEAATTMAIAAVNVLEYAEERGTEDDKQRALSTINSPQFKALYDKVSPEVREAMGKKVIQYNRDTFANNAKRLITELDRDHQSVKFNTTSGKFEIKRTGNLPSSPEEVIGFGRELRAQKAKVDALNKQLDVVKIYAKDDPYLASLTPVEQRDFFVISAGLPNSAISGKLTRPTQEQKQAESKGITVKDLEIMTKKENTSKKAVDTFAMIEQTVIDSHMSPEQQQAVIQATKDIMAGKGSDSDEFAKAIQDAGSDEDAFEIVKEIRAMKASADSRTTNLIETLPMSALKRFNSLSREDREKINSMSPDKIADAIQNMRPE